MRLARHVVDELSAYLDGEVQDPDRIFRHLQSCPACARRHDELRMLSARLKAMRGPEVHPAFVTRVMAHTADAPLERGWILRLSPRLTTALCVLVLAAVGGWRWMPRTAEVPAVTNDLPRVNVAWQNDDNVVEALSQLMASGARVDVFGDLDEPAEMDEAVVGLDTVLESLAEASVGAEVIDPFSQDDLSDYSDITGDDAQPLVNDLRATGQSEV